MSQRPLALNHVELVYRPGEQEAARALFETLGFGVTEWRSWLVIKIDPENGDGIDNVMYANEPSAAWQNYDAAFSRALETDPDLAEALRRHRAVRQEFPFFAFHWGASIPTLDEWQARRKRLEEARENDPVLKGKFDMSVFEPGDRYAPGPQCQCFVHTDILACGPFAQGLTIELQHTTVPVGEGTIDDMFPEGDKLPDPSTLV